MQICDAYNSKSATLEVVQACIFVMSIKIKVPVRAYYVGETARFGIHSDIP